MVASREVPLAAAAAQAVVVRSQVLVQVAVAVAALLVAAPWAAETQEAVAREVGPLAAAWTAVAAAMGVARMVATGTRRRSLHCHHRRSSASRASTVRTRPGSDDRSTGRIRASCPQSYSPREVAPSRAMVRGRVVETVQVRLLGGNHSHS